MKKMKLLTCMAAALSVSAMCSAQVQLVKKGKPTSRIVVTTTEQADSTAASLLQDFVQRTTQAKLPIIPADEVKKVKKGDVLIGNGMSNASLVSDKLKEDGFLIKTDDGMLRIVSGGDGGSIYGVTTVLEDYLGVRYWGENEFDINPSKDVTIPKVNKIDNPAFKHRQTHFYGLGDPLYKLFSRFEWVDELFAGNYWVHTVLRLVPIAQYGQEHPEYYAMVDGKRNLSGRTQLCMSNPELFELIAHKVDSIFKANPDRDMISISQNDGDKSWCRCPECQKIIDEEGSPCGPYLRFMNKMAQRFPDKQISTLSYLFTVVPPKITKPLPNVNLMLCNINCTRELPLDQIPSKSNKEFMDALEKWSSMTNNIFLWDYGINFHNFVSPYPNLHVIAENMRIFRKNHVNTYFHQLGSVRGEDLAELRTWLVSKLMWNPDADTDELINTFLKGYYGEASAPYLYQYIKLMEGALMGSRHSLWIYDTPVSFKNDIHNPALMRRYNELFDKAEKAAANDSTHLARIQRTRVPLQYADLEILRNNPGYDVNEASAKLEYFHKQCKRFNISLLSERGLREEQFYELYKNRFLSLSKTIAPNAKISYLIEPHRRYAGISQTALTDGLLGGNTFNNSWVGWEGTDGSFVVDLGEEKDVNGVDVDFLISIGDWIYPPKNVSFFVSNDNKNFKKIGTEKLEGKNIPSPYFNLKYNFASQKARYIRVDVDGQKIMPNSTNLAWFFIDEVRVH